MIRNSITSLGLFVVISMIALSGFLVVPHSVRAEPGDDSNYLVSDCNQELDGNGDFVQPCNLNELLLLIRKIIRFVVIQLTLPIAAIGFAVAGGMYLTSAVSSKKADAKRVLLYIVYGLLIIIAAWLIVEAIYRGLGYDAGVLIFT